MNPVRTLDKDLQLHSVSICDSETEKMTKSNAKNEPSSSVSTDTSGLRRSARETPSKKQSDNASPGSVRKSLRLENRPASETASIKKKSEKPSPLRRSGRENKFQTPSSVVSGKGSTSKGGGLKQQKSSKSPVSQVTSKEQTLKEVAEGLNGIGKQNAKLGTERKKRLSARSYKALFAPVNKKMKVSDSSKERTVENCDDDGGDRKSESNEGGQQEDSDGKELKENGSINSVVHTEGSNSDSKKEAYIDKHCESEAVTNLLPSMTADIPMSSPVTEARENEAEDMEAVCSTREKLDSQEEPMTSNELSIDSNCSRFIPKATNLGAPVVRSVDGHTCCEDVLPSISSSRNMINLTENCTKCNRKRRLDYNALEVELCCCLSNSMDDVDMRFVSKDRGECGSFLTTQCAENEKQSEPPVHGERGTCFTCKSTGMLLHCGGKECRRSFHASCLSTPEENLNLPMWYCSECTKKRLTLGVHSVSEGIESIWDVREVELSNPSCSNMTGVKKQKQYFVKYKGLAHIDNHWVPETQLLCEVPELLAEFGERKEVLQWKPVWVVPQRLLKKRPIIVDDSNKDNASVGGIILNCQFEWLVKWCHLDYDHATWELEDSSWFKAPDVQRLIREYEARHERARIPLSRGNEVQERRKGSHFKTGKHLTGGLFAADSCYMNSINRLRECYHKRQNAVLLDEQDRILKVVCLVSSMVINLCRPILIISPRAFLSLWEAEFLRFTTSIDVVIYGGCKDARKIVRSLEFPEGDNIMLQVLLTSVEVVSEDLNMIKDIKWEAVIVDDYQDPFVMGHCGSVKNLVTNWRLLLVNAKLKDDVADYINILSLLESGDTSNQTSGPMANSGENIDMLKERLSSFISCARFLEYWVPVQISNLQLEQYCSLILSNHTALLSNSKSDPVDSLRDILISTRKCCDHPYIVDASLQTSLIGGLTDPTLAAVLDLGTRASGKLTFLDEVLSEFRNQELKVLILFQSVGGSGRDSKGDILDDFLRIRFGPESYERLDGGCLSSKKQSALNKFNNEKRRTFFLLEARACLPSIKLSSVDGVIVFDSDWNPLNDLRALQRITIDSKLEQIKVFRLYCSWTIEEKVLVLAKNDMILDSNLQGISPSTSHMLLMWGASYLFSLLDEFHHDKVADCRDNIMPESSYLKYVCEEILSVVQNHTVNSSKYIAIARQNGGGYVKDTALIGEQNIHLEVGALPHLFWMKLLEGKQPQWRYLSGSSQRIRKRVHYQELEDQGNEATKKSRKMERNKGDSSFQPVALNLEKANAGGKGFHEIGTTITNNLEFVANTNFASLDKGGTTMPALVNDFQSHINSVEPKDRKNLYDEQWDLFQVLKPAISRLCEAIRLKDDGKRLAEQFLEYVLKNHRVMAEPEAILQAFQISVCWTAAEVLDQKIDHGRSLDIARENLNFNCREEEAEAVYSKTKIFMKIFLRRSDGSKILNSSNDSGSVMNSITRASKEHSIEVEGNSVVDCFDEQLVSLVQTTDDKNEILRFIKKVKNKCDKQLERLKDKQSKELEMFEKKCDDDRADLEKKYKMESAIIRSIHGKSSVGVEKLKIVDKSCAKERDDQELQNSICRKELEARHLDERDKEQKKTEKLLEQVNSLTQNELLDTPPSENGNQLEVAELLDCDHSKASVCIAGKHLVKHNFSRESSGIPGPDMTPIVSEVGKLQENTMISEVPYLGADELRINHPSDASMNSSKDVLSFNEAGFNITAEDNSCPDLPKMQAVPIAETDTESPLAQTPAASMREMESNEDQMESLEVGRSTVSEINHEARASLSTEPLPSPGISISKQPAADPSSEAPVVSQGLGNGSHQSPSGGADDLTQHVSEACNVPPQDENSSLGCPDPIRSNLLPDAGVGGFVVTPHAYDQTRIPSRNRLGDQSGDVHTSVQDTVSLIRQQTSVTNLGETVSRLITEPTLDNDINVNLGQFETHTSTRGAFPGRASRPNPQVPIFSVSRSPDPLQNELERIHKEIDEFVNKHEETKMQLRSECNKEIEEMVAQIRKKYEEKNKEIEASFSLKRSELEVNQNKVMMHKILAEAFRSKCMDYRAASGMQQQAIPSGSTDRFTQIQPAGTSSSTSGSISAILPAASSHNAAFPSRAIHSSSAFPSSPPYVNPLAPTSGFQVRTAVRTPTPHHLPFRSASVPVSSSSTPIPCRVSAEQPPSSNPPPSSAPQFPARPPLTLNSDGQSRQARSAGTTSSPLSFSAIELLKEKRVQNNANIYLLDRSSLTLPDSVQNFRTQDVPRFETTTTNLQKPPSGLGAENDVVCLSDDE